MDFVWPDGKRAALSFTFDDARHSQIERAIPILDRFDIRATFYVNIGGVRPRLGDWQKAVAAGHEIGNHSLSHPCTGNFDFVRSGNALEEYTLDRIDQDIAGASDAIQEVLGLRPTTFAYPCGQKFVGRGADVQSYVPLIARRFLAGRGYRDESANNPSFCDLAQLLGRDADTLPVDRIKGWIEDAAKKGHYLILVMHSIDGPSPLNVTSSDLEELCRFASDAERGLWVDTVDAIAGWIAHARIGTG